MKSLISAVALATLIAGPALAQTFDSPGSNPESTQAAPRAVIDKGRVIARDPDPWIRNEILRHSHSGWPD
jgi:hypothetical protein